VRAPFLIFMTKKTVEKIIIERDGVTHNVSRSSFENIYTHSGWTITDESNSQAKQSSVADGKTAGDSGQGGSAKRRAARKPNKAKNSRRT
jgi:hypothetical protein